MQSHVGRGAPEIDILEAMPGRGPLLYSKVGKPYFSTSLQIAPGITSNRPGPGLWPGPGQWYEGLEFGDNSTLNIFFYGTVNAKSVGPKALPKYTYWSDAVSGNTQLDAHIWGSFHTMSNGSPKKFAEDSNLDDDEVAEVAGMGYIRWYLDDKLIYGSWQRPLKKRKSPSGRLFDPQHCDVKHGVSNHAPMAAIASADCLDEPQGSEALHRVSATHSQRTFLDYVRAYQNRNETAQKVSSTPERPTSKWIKVTLTRIKMHNLKKSR